MVQVRNTPTSYVPRLSLPGFHLSEKREALLTRLGGIAVFALLVILFVAGVPVLYTQMKTVCTGDACQHWQPGPGDLATLHSIGIPLNLLEVSYIALDAAFLLCFMTVSAVLVRRRGDRMAVFCSFMLLALGASFTQVIRAAASGNRIWWLPVHLLQFCSLSLLIMFFYLFPDG